MDAEHPEQRQKEESPHSAYSLMAKTPTGGRPKTHPCHGQVGHHSVGASFSENMGGSSHVAGVLARFCGGGAAVICPLEQYQVRPFAQFRAVVTFVRLLNKKVEMMSQKHERQSLSIVEPRPHLYHMNNNDPSTYRKALPQESEIKVDVKLF